MEAVTYIETGAEEAKAMEWADVNVINIDKKWKDEGTKSSQVYNVIS